MDSDERLVTVTENDINWTSLKKLPEDAVYVAQCLSFHFPSFIRGFKNGVARVDWQLNPDGRYYMDDDGIMQTGWQVIDGERYYFDGNGVMLTGWHEIDDVWYYFSESGVLRK